MGLMPQVLYDARHGSHVTSDTRSGSPKAKPLFPRSTVCLGGGSVTSQPAPKPGSMGPLPVFLFNGSRLAGERASLRGIAYSRDDPCPRASHGPRTASVADPAEAGRRPLWEDDHGGTLRITPGGTTGVSAHSHKRCRSYTPRVLNA